MQDNFPIWLGEISYCEDLGIQWDYIKYKIRQEKLSGKNRKKIKECKEKNLENLERI